MDRLQNQLQQSVETMMTDLDRSRMRSLNQKTFLDMARCFDEKGYNPDSVESCQKMAGNRLQRAEQIIKGQMNQLQGRIQRCSQTCQDEVSVSLPQAFQSGATPAQQQEAEKNMIVCASSCVEKNIAMLKGIQQRIEADLDALNK